MDNLIGYNNLEQLYVGESIIVYRALREVDGRSVILKMLKEEYPDPTNIARLVYEYNLLKNLTIPDIVHTEGFEKQQNHYAIVLEDIPNSCTLREYISTHKISIEDFLYIAIQLADALHQLHEAHIIHKDINPDNILISKDGKLVKLMDLSIATQLTEEEQAIINPETLEGTLPYISPEQTTRMNRSIDRRTDLYSLGITFYEMLIGRLPFEANDAIEWVSYHIAKQPLPPHEISPHIPPMISKIILKLLAKSAEDRYSTALGLKKDLETCLTAWEKNQTIFEFPLGAKDRASTFHIPQKLFGREKEIHHLLEVFEKVNRGAREVLFVEGPSGIGKSSLINEIQKPITRQRGYFITGKYTQYQSDIPYDGLIQAFRQLIQHVLTESTQQVSYWREQLTKALSPNGQIIINVIPEVERLIGKQPPVVELPPTEARTRFELVFFDFVSVFARKDHPLVLFLDDMQWADTGSFNLLTQLLQDTEVNYFLLLCSYRDKEVAATHPLFEMKKQFIKSNVMHATLQLKPLTQKSVTELISETLNTQNSIEELSKLVMEKTGGNPYFVNLFLTSLYKNHQLVYDENQDQWVWDIQTLRNLPITDNVADLVINEIHRLPEAVQEALKTASCIGSRFTLANLLSLINQPAEAIAKLLWIALEEKWIIPVGGNYKLALTDTNIVTNSTKIIYRFSHDRVQQALYSLIPEERQKEIHLKLGYLLLAEFLAGNEHFLFNVVHHFSICLQLIQTEEERFKISEIFRQAANKAKFSIAYDVAVTYLKSSLQLLGDKAWEEHYELAFDSYLNLANCQYLSGAYEQADIQFTEVIKKAKTNLEKAKVLQYQALAYTIQSKYAEGADIAEKGLSLLGVKLPHSYNKLRLAWEFIKTKWLLRKKTVKDLLNLPLMQDPEKIIIMELLENVATFSLVANPNNYSKTICVSMQAIDYSLTYGNYSSSAQCYLHFALIEFIRGNVDSAYEYVQIAIKLAERFNQGQLGMVYVLSMRILPWKISYKDCLAYLNKASQLNFESGNLSYYQYSAIAIISMMLLANYSFSEIEEKIKTYLTDYQYTRNDSVVFGLKMYQSIIEILHGTKTIDEYQNLLNTFSSSEAANRISRVILLGSKSLLLTVAYLYEDWPLALATIESLEKDFQSSRAMSTLFVTSSYQFYKALTLCSIYHQARFVDRLRYKKIIKSILKNFQRWSTYCPENHQTQYFLLKAALLELNGNMKQALIEYEKCLKAARDTDRVFLEGVAHDYIARCFIRDGQMRTARSYLEYACAAYRQVDAMGKVNYLFDKYPEWLIQPAEEAVGSIHSSHHRSSRILDLDTVLKSAQTISSHMKLEDLLENLITIVVENAGAQRGIILLMEHDQLVVEAEGGIDLQPHVLQREPIDNRNDLALSLVRFVQNSREAVILGDASVKGPYTEDPYIREKKPLSILCAPVIYHDTLLGILYLENNLVREAFTKKHLELLHVLSAQIAISLENARLYTAYDQFIPHEFLDILGKRSVVDIRLGDNVQKEMAVLFTDIRGFSKLSEQLGPAKIFRLMNNYLGYMEPIIKKQGGFIDKFIGDAIMALFAGTADSAVLAAIGMQKELVNFNQETAKEGQSPIEIGIGINTGSLILGTLGSRGRLETSVISDAVNVAERIQELTKEYECRLLISDSTYKQLVKPERFEARFIGRTAIRGKAQEIGIWEVYNGDPEELRYAKLAIAKHYNEAIVLFSEGAYSKALSLFQRCLISLPNDKAIQRYIDSCQKQASS